MPYSQVLSGCQMLKNILYYHYIQYQAYPTSQSRKKSTKTSFSKNRRKMTKSGSLVNQCEGKKIKNR